MKLTMPPSLVILCGILILSAIATLVLPQGEYERVERNFPQWIPHTIEQGDTLESIAQATNAGLLTLDDLRPTSSEQSEIVELRPGTTILVPVGGMTRSSVVPNSYTPSTDQARVGIGKKVRSAMGSVAVAPMAGFSERAQIIGFVLLLGGSFGIILATGAIDQGLAWGVMKLGNGSGRLAVIPISFILFSLGGAVFGMGESTIAFVLITVPLAIRLGYDTLTGIAMCYMASQVGFAGAFFNPFTIGIAQGIAELPYLSGLNFRYVVWIVVTAIGILFTMLWAAKVRKDPKLSPTFAMDQRQRDLMTSASIDEQASPTLGQWATIALAFGSVFGSGYGVAKLDWYIDEMAALFVIVALGCGLLSKHSMKRMSDDFIAGASLMVEPVLIIAVSAGVVSVLANGLVLDTILSAMAEPLASLPPSLSAVALMLFQAMLNFLVPSGSGQAAMTMPLVTPLCDLVGLDRQVGVLSFQFGDGFGNLVVPTSAVLMGVLGAAKVPWGTWVRWVLPIVITLHIAAAIFLVVAANAPTEWLR